MPHNYLRQVLEMAEPFAPDDYEHLYRHEMFADVDLSIRDEEDEANVVRMPAHSVVLLGQSEFCKTQASDTTAAACATINAMQMNFDALYSRGVSLALPAARL
jgi:hypothetical protein